MGRTVAELDATMSLEEFYNWMSYYEFEPFGTEAEDNRWRQHFQLVWAINSKEGYDAPKFLDRDPEETARLKRLQERQEAATMDDRMLAFFGRFVSDK